MRNRDLKKSVYENRLLEIKALQREHLKAKFRDGVMFAGCLVAGVIILILNS